MEGGLCPAMNLELFVDVREVIASRSARDAEPSGNFLVCKAMCCQGENFGLTRTKPPGHPSLPINRLQAVSLGSTAEPTDRIIPANVIPQQPGSRSCPVRRGSVQTIWAGRELDLTRPAPRA